MQVIVLCGGKGSRFGERCKFLPKSMLPLAGKPIIARLVESVVDYGYRDVLFLLGHQGKAISEYFNSGSYFGINPTYVQETEPLGTAGCLKAARDKLDKEFLLLHGDHIIDVDLFALKQFHKDKNSSLTIVTHPSFHPFDSDLAQVDKLGRITKIWSKPQPHPLLCKNLAISGVAIVKSDLIDTLPDGPSDLTKDLYTPAVKLSKKYLYPKCYSYQTSEYLIDVGTQKRLDKAEKEFTQERCKKRPAVFLDRDGTINEQQGFVNSPDDVKVMDRAYPAIKLLHEAGYLIVVVTNQGGIQLGFITEETLDQIHARIDSQLAEFECFVDKYYHCPHYEESGVKICDCRKPGVALIDQAISEFNIDLENSWVVGDRTGDIKMADNKNLKSILVKTGSAGEDQEFPDAKPTFVENDLYEAAKKIVGER